MRDRSRTATLRIRRVTCEPHRTRRTTAPQRLLATPSSNNDLPLVSGALRPQLPPHRARGHGSVFCRSRRSGPAVRPVSCYRRRAAVPRPSVNSSATSGVARGALRRLERLHPRWRSSSLTPAVRWRAFDHQQGTGRRHRRWYRLLRLGLFESLCDQVEALAPRDRVFASSCTGCAEGLVDIRPGAWCAATVEKRCCRRRQRPGAAAGACRPPDRCSECARTRFVRKDGCLGGRSRADNRWALDPHGCVGRLGRAASPTMRDSGADTNRRLPQPIGDRSGVEHPCPVERVQPARGPADRRARSTGREGARPRSAAHCLPLPRQPRPGAGTSSWLPSSSPHLLPGQAGLGPGGCLDASRLIPPRSTGPAPPAGT